VGSTQRKLEEVRDYIVFTYQHSILKVFASLDLDDQGSTSGRGSELSLLYKNTTGLGTYPV